MDKVRIVHCSDLHFDTPFGDLDSRLSQIRQEEIRETFSRIIDLCKSEKADILLICGDLFDNYSVKKMTLYFLKDKFCEIPDVKVFMVAGNHDPLNERSFYKMIDWPGNVYIFENKVEEIKIDELNTTVVGASFKENYEKKSFLSQYFPGNNDDNIRIMLMHGEITDREDSNEYNPITEQQIENTKVSYAAFGHRHAFSGLKKCGMTTYAYCGCPEGRGFDEVGPKGVILGDVYKNGVELKFVPLNKRTYEEIEVDITGAMSNDFIKSRILNVVDENHNHNIYCINLTGEISDEFILNIETISSILKPYFFAVKVKDKTTVKLDIEKLSREYSIKGLFSAKMLKRIEEAETEDEKEKLMKALKIGLQSLSTQEVN